MNRERKSNKNTIILLLFLVLLTLGLVYNTITAQAGIASMQGEIPQLAKANITLYCGYKTYAIQIINLKKDASVTFKSSNKKVAKVSTAGIITPDNKGTATITSSVKQSNHIYTLKTEVTVKYPYIKITAQKDSLNVGEHYTFKSKGYGVGGKIYWSSSDDLIAAVDENSGKVTAVSEGTVSIIASSYSTTASCTLKVVENKTVNGNSTAIGNTGGNIANRGGVAQQGDWIYYLNDSDSYNNIYKIRTDGSDRIKLSNDNCRFINVVGDWIYYQYYGDGGKLYKIRTDGSDRTILNDDDSWYINVVGDWIYYQNCSDGGKLYKIRTDGSDRSKLNNDDSWYINVVDDLIYYQNCSDDGKIYKIRTDGSGRSKLNNDSSTFINVVSDWIYYLNDSDIHNNIYKIRTDGSDRTKLNNDLSAFINVVSDWIYYTNADDRFSIYKIRTDGSDRTKLNNDFSTFINVVGDWIYYKNVYDNNKIYKIRTDGTQNELVK
jgi:uncharacterized protein YchJ